MNGGQRLMSNRAATEMPSGALRVDDDHVKRVVRKMLNGLVVPLLGAGVNMPSRPKGSQYSGPDDSYLPSGPELARYLVANFEYGDLAFRRREDLLRVSQLVEVMEGSGELYQRLHDVFSASYAPGLVHMFLARLQPMLREAGKGSQVILTTNYDDALERAFESVGEDYDLLTYVCTHPAEHRGRFAHRAPGATEFVPIERPNEYADLDPRERPVILKMHGAVVRCDTFEQDNYVITEDHYIDYLAHTDITQLLPTPIPQRLRNSHFLFLGYGMADWNLRVILRRIWGAQGLDYPSWSIQYEPDRLETKSWEDRGVAVFDIDVAKYVEHLRVELVNRLGLRFPR
jgi:SIR2-like protein